MRRTLAAALTLALGLSACGESPRLVVSWDSTRVEADLPGVVEALRARRPQRALDELDRLEASGALPDGALHFRALALGDLGRTQDALDAWNAELAAHPGNGRAHALLARLEIERGRLDDAARHLEEARRHAPDFPLVLLLEGRLAMLRDDDERGARAFRDFLVRDPYGPSSAEAYHALSQIAARRGTQGAEEAQRFQELSEQLEQVHAYLARYEERLAADPDDVEAAYGVAAAYLNLYVNLIGDRALLRQVEPALVHVLERQPRHVRALYNMGFVRLEQQRDEEAAEYLHSAIEADPGFAPARINLGTLLLKSGDAQGAVRELERALAVADTEEDRGRAHLQLGHAREQLGTPEDLTAAIAHFRAVLAQHPDDPLGLQAVIAELERRLDGGSGDSGETDSTPSSAPGHGDTPR